MEITKKEFKSYEDVRRSGVTNMFAVDVVGDLSGLEKKQIIEIIKHYSELSAKYPDVVKDE